MRLALNFLLRLFPTGSARWCELSALYAIAALALAVLIIVALYLLGGKLAAKGKPSPGKYKPYACGEDLPPPEPRVNLMAFFWYILFFVVFDVVAFIIATSYGVLGTAAPMLKILPAVYLALAIMAVLVLFPLRRE